MTLTEQERRLLQAAKAMGSVRPSTRVMVQAAQALLDKGLLKRDDPPRYRPTDAGHALDTTGVR